MGIPGIEGDFRVMRDNLHHNDSQFWSLPDDIQQIVNDRDVRDIMLQRQELLGIPNVRYARDSPAFARQLQRQSRERAAAAVAQPNDLDSVELTCNRKYMSRLNSNRLGKLNGEFLLIVANRTISLFALKLNQYFVNIP